MEYLNFLFSIFSSFIGPKGSPQIHTRKPDRRTGKVYSTIAFKTRALPCFTMYHNLFYINGVKTVPTSIASLVTPVALAFWIMDDGSFSVHGQTILHTNAYTPAEIILLQQALLINFKLRTRVIQKLPNQQLIAIPVKQEVDLKSIVGSYMHDSMKYKIGM